MSYSSKKYLQPFRSCYGHMAGEIGVAITEALEAKGYIQKEGKVYIVTDSGWKFFEKLDIHQSNFAKSKRVLTRQCTDWTEKRPHLAGQLGDALMQKFFEKKWIERVGETRKLELTDAGRDWLRRELVGEFVRLKG